MATAPKVQVGQVYADNDSRQEGRTLEVTEVHPGSTLVEPYAVMRVLTNARNVGKDNIGRTRRVKQARLLRRTSSGYRLVSGPGAPTPVNELVDGINEVLGEQRS